MHPRGKSSEAQSRQLILQQIADKRAQSQQATAFTRPTPQTFEYADLEDSPSEDLEDLEDLEDWENRPPPIIAEGKKAGLSRLKQNSSTMSALDGIVNSVQKLSLARPAANTGSASGSSTLPGTSRAALPPASGRAVPALLAQAAALKLPSDSGDDGSSSSDQESEESEEVSDQGAEEEEEEYSDSEEDQEAVQTQAPGLLAASGSSGQVRAAETGDLVLPGKAPEEQFILPANLHNKLYPHQVEGVRWLWSLQVQRRGGILGDDMGLGKTMQCSAFLAGLLHSKRIRRAMVVAPKTLLLHWEKELAVCGLGRRTHAFYGDSVSERDAALRAAAGSTGGVLLTTYGMILHNAAKLSSPPSGGLRRAGEDARDFAWDLVILDEGHKVKNPKMKLVQELRKIPAGIIVIISGTPIQNNLAELHALFDLCCEGLLGDRKSFKQVYERHITAGQDRGATPRQRDVGAAVAGQLRTVIAPFFLRREKKEVLCAPSQSSAQSAVTQSSASEASASSSGQAKPLTLSHKNDLVVWLRLQPLQRSVYTSFLHSDAVKGALNETDSALAALTVLKKICDHPALLSAAAAKSVIAGGNRWAKHGQGKGKVRRSSYSSESSDDSGDEVSCTQAAGVVAELLPALGGDVQRQLVEEMQHKGASASCKSVFVLALLDELAAKGHRTLVFSQSRVMLDILQAAVVARDMEFCRIDGNVSSAEDRQAEVKRFQRPGADIPVFLLTSQVGGLGLTLTAADRVVIVDPSWNPATDNQAVDRAYRIGQTRDVVVYRLITCGTVEEKIYRKQVFKGGLSRTGTEEGVQFRYFTQQQLRDLFTVTDEGLKQSATQQQLHKLHASQRQATPEFNQHLEFLKTMTGFAGISDHDLLFSAKPAEPHQNMTAAEGATLVGELEAAAAKETQRAPSKRSSSGASGSKGKDDLSELFNASLSLGGEAQAARLQRTLQQRRVDDLQKRLDSTNATINGLASRLGDGGGKLLRQRDVLQSELELELANLHRMQPQQPATATQQGSSSWAAQSLGGGSRADPPPAPVSTQPAPAPPAWRQFAQTSTQAAAQGTTLPGTQQWGTRPHAAPQAAPQPMPAVQIKVPAPSQVLPAQAVQTLPARPAAPQPSPAISLHDTPAAAGYLAATPASSLATGGPIPTPASSEAASTGGSGQRGLRLAYGSARRQAAATPPTVQPSPSSGATGGPIQPGLVAQDDTVSLVSGSFLTADSEGEADSDVEEVTSLVGHRGAAPAAAPREKAQPRKEQSPYIDLTSD